jgi:hypothetical protein
MLAADQEDVKYFANLLQPGDASLVTLSSLRSLSTVAPSLGLLPYLSTPSLINLTIDVVSNASQCDPLHLIPFLQPMHGRLEVSRHVPRASDC